jgi:hypothetical protein
MANDRAPKQPYTKVCGLDGGWMYLMCREEVRPQLTPGYPNYGKKVFGGEFKN